MYNCIIRANHEANGLFIFLFYFLFALLKCSDMFRVIFVILWSYNSSYPSRFQARNVSIFQLNLGKIDTLFVDIILNSLSCNRICSQLKKNSCEMWTSGINHLVSSLAWRSKWNSVMNRFKHMTFPWFKAKMNNWR